ncbi:MAG TPA: hypothetical protein VFV66_10095 [Nonomuraea sp.]|nr:hypothetical protein [Nonomuraea sp.]
MPVITKTLATLAALGAAGLTLAATSAPAQAAVSVACDASGTTNFTPGVQAVPISQQISYRGDDRTCSDHTGFGIRSARITADLHNVELSCLASGGGSGSGSATIEWTTGGGRQTSEIDITIDSSVLNSGKVSGVVRRGPFEGQRFSGQFDTNLLTGAFSCTFGAPLGGVKNATFNGHYTIG